MLLNGPDAESAILYLLAALAADLGQGGAFDYQRQGSHLTGFRQLPQFKHVSNVNVGLYAQQAGLSLDEILSIAGRYASVLSRNAKPNQPYGLDPRTAEFIRIGYELGRNVIFGQPAAP